MQGERPIISWQALVFFFFLQSLPVFYSDLGKQVTIAYIASVDFINIWLYLKDIKRITSQALYRIPVPTILLEHS